MNAVAELIRVGDPSTSVAEYSATAEALAVLREKYTNARYDVATTAGMQAALEARRNIRGYRVALEKKRAEIKAPALERCKQIDSEARRITAALEALEDPIDAQIKVEEQRKENEKAARDQAERARVLRNNEVIDEIRGAALHAIGKSSTEIGEILNALRTEKPDVDDDFSEPAHVALQKTLTQLESMFAEKRGNELEAQRLADERAEHDRRMQVEQARIAEENRIAAEKRAEEDRVAQAERDRLAAEERGRIMAETVARREAEEAERKRVDAERAEADRLAQIERDRIAEQQRQIDADRAELRQQQEAEALKRQQAESEAQAQRDRAEAEERIRAESAQAERDAEDARARQARRKAAIEAAGIKFASVPNNWRALYNAVNEVLVAELIDMRKPLVAELMMSLKDIDGGEYVPMPMDRGPQA